MHPPIQVPKSRKHAVTRVLATGIHESLFVLLFEPGSNMLIGGIILIVASNPTRLAEAYVAVDGRVWRRK